MIDELNECTFWLKWKTYSKNIILLGIKSVLIYKKDFDSVPVYNKELLKPKLKSYGDEITDF